MSVVIIARMKVAPSALEEQFTSQEDTFKAVSEDAKKAGAIHHRFLAGDGEVVIVDEWNTAEAFQAFFADPRIAGLMQNAGVAGPPEVSVYQQMDSPDLF
jgi:heme-degrading monooxygenase HmoA